MQLESRGKMECAEIVLREYREDDLEAIVRLDDACFAAKFRFDRESMRRFAEDPNAIALVAEVNAGTVAGFVIVQVERTVAGRQGYVVTLDVAHACRRTGLATKLMEAVEMRVAAAGARWIGLHVFTGNDGAIGFYDRQGYERIGLKRRFYGRAGDAFMYRKRLINS